MICDQALTSEGRWLSQLNISGLFFNWQVWWLMLRAIGRMHWRGQQILKTGINHWPSITLVWTGAEWVSEWVIDWMNFVALTSLSAHFCCSVSAGPVLRSKDLWENLTLCTLKSVGNVWDCCLVRTFIIHHQIHYVLFKCTLSVLFGCLDKSPGP